MRLRIREKILLITVTTFLLAIGVNTLFISRMFREGYSAALQSKMDVIANTLRSQIERLLKLGIAIDNIEGFEAQCQEILDKHKDVAYVMVARVNGRILFHNDPARHDTMINDPGILKALKGGRQTACLSEVSGQMYYNTVVPVQNGSNEPTVAVVVGFPTKLIDSKVQELRQYSFMVAFVSLGLATFLLLTILSISVTKPLSSLVTTIQQIRDSSDLSKRVEIVSKDEVGDLAHSFNQMTEDLQRRTTSIENLNREIDHRKKVEGQLRKAEEKYRVQFEGALDAIFVADAETGILVDCNPAATRLVGREKSELVGKHQRILHPPKVIEGEFSSTYKQHLEEKQDQTLETQVITKKGEIRDVAVKANLLEVGGKKVLQGIFRDITENKKAEQRQTQLLRELEKTNQELNDFAYITSHDLKAPLRGIATLANWISTDYADKLDEQGREQINLLTRQVARMHNLINGILQYSRIGRVEEEKVVVNLNELVSEVTDMSSPPENITITVENELPTIECERTRIMQVFQNLISNAVKYMDKPQGRIKVGCVEENGFWKFSVADNGPGIEEKYFEKIFQIFQTLSPRDEVESTGIGLSLVKKIVEMYDGEVWVESQPGKGSIFFFTLPKQEMGVKDEKLEVSINRYST